MSENQVLEQPIRAGVLSNLTEAQVVVKRLMEEGFTTEQVTVVCSDESIESHFRQFEHQDPAGKSLPGAATAGSTIGAMVGGLAAAAAGAATGNVTLALLGGAAGVCTGGILGGFLGAMMTRGIEREAADFYDQAVTEGEVLITVNVQGEDAQARLTLAEQVLTEAGAKAIPLRES